MNGSDGMVALGVIEYEEYDYGDYYDLEYDT